MTPSKGGTEWLKLLAWAQQFKVICFLDSAQGDMVDSWSNYEYLLALSNKQPKSSYAEALDSWQKEWVFGYLSYDTKNNLYKNLHSSNADHIKAPEALLFTPELLISKRPGQKSFVIEVNTTDKSNEAIRGEIRLQQSTIPKISPTAFKARMSKQEYMEAVNNLLRHIQLGDIYEINFCQEFVAHPQKLPPLSIYQKLRNLTQAPFSSFIKYGELSIFSASLERFVRKQGMRIISQPIKGTAPITSEKCLRRKKERSENIMVTDLVRNDLAKVCLNDSVKVEELCKVYRFQTVSHLISTISCQLGKERHPLEIVLEMFPPASMTGVPKKKAMELIERYEATKRGVYSGTIGYITPEGDLDFNVVIRTLVHNQKTNCLSLLTGGAITANSDPEEEYEECLLKANAMFKVFS